MNNVPMTETHKVRRLKHSNLKPSYWFRASNFVLRTFVAAVVVVCFSTVSAAAEVRLRSSAVCTSAVVRLNDVAEIYAEDRRLAQALAETPLCPSPQAGQPRSISQHELRQMLLVSGVEKSVAVTGSETVSIASELGGRSALLPKRPLVASGVRQAAFEAEAEMNQKSTGRPSLKMPSVSSTDNKPAPQAPLIDKGTGVTVHAIAAGVKVTTSGKALEPGAAGATIAVELADSKQRVQGRIVGPQTVEVAAGASAASR